MSINKNRVDTTFWDKFKLDEGFLSLIALLLAFMTVVWSIQSGNWLEGLYVLSWAGLFGFGIGFLLSRIRFVPSLLAHSFMLSVGMVVTGLLVAPFVNVPFADWSKKLGSAVLRVVKWCENAIAGNAREDSLVYLIFLALAIWTLGYMVAWFVFRLNVVWPALAMLAAALMINLSFNPPNATAAFVFFLLNALLLVIRFNAFQNELRWRSLRMYFPGGIWRNALGVGGFLALLILAASFVIPSQSGYKTLGDVISNVTTPFNDFKGIWDNIGTGGTGSKGDQLTPRSNANYNSLDDSFTIGGPLKLSNNPVFRVSADGGQMPLYLQGKTMDFYDGKGWINSYQTTADGKLANNEAVFRRLSLAPNQALPTPPNAGQGSTRLNVTSLVPGFTPVLSLGDLVSVDRPALVAFHYEKIALNVPLDSFKLKDFPDGNGGKRTVLVDERTGEPVPPSALELVRLLSEAANSGQFGYPNKLTAFYTKRANEWQVQYQFGNDRIQSFSRNGQTSQSLVAVKDNWRYTLPNIQDLLTLNMQPGSAPYTGKLVNLRVTTQQNQDMPIEMNVTLYLNTAGVYRLEVESPLAKNNAARESFEGSEIGKKIATEVKRIEDAVKGNNVEVTLENGRPARLIYNGFEPNYDDLTGGVLVQGINVGENYAASAHRYRADVQSLRRVGTSQPYPSWVKERYLKMPEGQTEFYKKLAEELTAGLTNPYDKAKAIESYLNSFTYSTEPPAPAAGQDEIQFFLSESKTGYCVHFSSAMALMLRSIGIPTRLATGFINGELDPTTNSWIVRANAAHAWTQVYFPGYGWIDFEPTPGREGIQRPADPSAVPPLPTPTPAPDVAAPQTTPPAQATAQPTPTPAADANPVTAGQTAGQKTEFPWWILWILAAGAAIGGLVYLRRWYIQQQLALPDPSPITVYQRMGRSARKAGLRGRTGMTAYEYATYLAKRVPEAQASIELMTEAYVRRRYGPEALAEYLAERERNNPAVVEADDAATTLLGGRVRAVVLDSPAMPQEPSEEQMRASWRDYQLAVMSYRRQQLRQRLVPRSSRSGSKKR